jgi:hypothetical protein
MVWSLAVGLIHRASSAFLLIQALVKQEIEDVKREARDDIPFEDHVIPSLPQHICRRVMTRADFLEKLNRLNIVAIDARSGVRASSVPMMSAFREICGRDYFDEMLENVLNRVSEVESLGRTRELEFKALKDEKSGTIQLKVEIGKKSWL